MTDRKLFTDDEFGHFEKWRHLFECEGWQLLVKEMEKELEDLPMAAFTTAKSFDEVVAMRVRARVIVEMLSYPTIIEQRKEHLVQEREFEASEQEDDDGARNL